MKENQKTADFLHQLKFIKEQHMPEKNLLELAQCLNLLEMKEDDIVFDFEEEADLFYIILVGSVSVLVPDKGKP